jgi:hypothetical protein
MKRACPIILFCGLLAVVFLVIHPDVDPPDFRVDASAAHAKIPVPHQSEAPVHPVTTISFCTFASALTFAFALDNRETRLDASPSLTKLSVLRI